MNIQAHSKNLARSFRSVFSPFTARAPSNIHDDLVNEQHRRLWEGLGILCLATIVTSVAATVALWGDLPIWQQLVPPAVLVFGSIALLARTRLKLKQDLVHSSALASLKRAPYVAGALGLLTGFWALNAFSETEVYYCVVAPVFVVLSVIMTANCLASIPQAATLAVIGALSPITLRLLVFDNLTLQLIAVMMIVIAAMQLWLIYSKFDETVRTLILQREMKEQATTDPLTRLSNRRVLHERFETLLAGDNPACTVLMIDLDGFKAANDKYGHHTGDRILIEVANRLQLVSVKADCIARLGGDEFAILYGNGISRQKAEETAGITKEILAMPYNFGSDIISISGSIGIGQCPDDGTKSEDLLHAADMDLYRQKGRIAEVIAA